MLLLTPKKSRLHFLLCWFFFMCLSSSSTTSPSSSSSFSISGLPVALQGAPVSAAQQVNPQSSAHIFQPIFFSPYFSAPLAQLLAVRFPFKVSQFWGILGGLWWYTLIEISDICVTNTSIEYVSPNIKRLNKILTFNPELWNVWARLCRSVDNWIYVNFSSLFGPSSYH